MSSRLTPPNPRAIAWTTSTISSGSRVSRQIGKASTPANSLNSIALPSITGMAALGPMSPRPSTAVPWDTTATELRLIVYWKALSGSASSSLAGRRQTAPSGQSGQRRSRAARPLWSESGDRGGVSDLGGGGQLTAEASAASTSGSPSARTRNVALCARRIPIPSKQGHVRA